jgi:hypothetical protein
MAVFNVVAAFDDTRKAQRAVQKLEQSGVEKSNVYVLRPGVDRDPDRMSELRAEMQEEVAEGVAGPGIGFMTPDQARGATAGVAIGAVAGAFVGAVIGLVWAFAAQSDMSPVLRFFFAFVPFALAGGVAGLIAGGAFKPRAEAAQHAMPMDDQPPVAERDTIVAVHVNDPDTAERAQHVLEELGAERVDAINADGTPLPPQAEHPRPADPPGRWWWPGRARG